MSIELEHDNSVAGYVIRRETGGHQDSTGSHEAEYIFLTPVTEEIELSGILSPAFKVTASNPDIVAGSQIEQTIIHKIPPASSSPELPEVESPEVESNAGASSVEAPFILTGKQIGFYKVESPIGRGGMGEVYLARDLRLGRPVALKLLRPDFHQTEEKVQRFRQEARAVSALNHPNIVTIYEVGEFNSAPCIISEYIEGRTLRTLIAGTETGRPLKLHRILEITMQLAGALGAAHQAGIIHRDIKPENIMVRGDGYVKVLDFGLAKLSESFDESGKSGKAFPGKVPGIVLGTVSYMSPEQARGSEVDQRTDIFSLGIVLYEMITGRKPFTGLTTSEILDSILSREPQPVAGFLPDAPAELQRIISRALDKERDRRYSTMNELMHDLSELRHELAVRSRQSRSDSANAVVSSRIETSPPVQESTDSPTLNLKDEPFGGNVTAEISRDTTELDPVEFRPEIIVPLIRERLRKNRFNLFFLLTSVVIALILALIFYDNWRAENFNSFENIRINRMTSSGDIGITAISPDGNYVAYSQADDAGREGLWLRHVSKAGAVEIIPASTASFFSLSFPPDGSHLYYIIKDRRNEAPPSLYRIPISGGEPEKLISNINSRFAFSSTGRFMAFFRHLDGEGTALFIADLENWRERRLAVRKEPDGFLNTGVAWSPDDERIACGVNEKNNDGRNYQSLVTVNVSDGNISRMSSDEWRNLGEMAWRRQDGGLFVIGDAMQGMRDRRDQIWCVTDDGQARRVTNDLNRYYGLSVAADGKTIAAVQVEDPLNIWLVPAAVSAEPPLTTLPPLTRQITFGSGRYYTPSWMPDGRIITDSDTGGKREIWIISREGQAQQLTTRDLKNLVPLITPDGRYLITLSSRSGRLNIWRSDLDESNSVQLTFGEIDNWPALSTDGKTIYYESRTGGNWTIWKVGVEGGRAPEQLTSVGNAGSPVPSPDGKFLAYRLSANPPERSGIVVLTADRLKPVRNFDLPTTAGGLIRWAQDGTALTFVDNRSGASEIWSQPLSGQRARQLTNFGVGRIFSFNWSPDGKNLVVARGSKVSDVVLLSR